MNLKILALVALPVIATSCSHTYSVKRYGIRATLADANTATPIAEAHVVVTVDGDKFAKTASRKGEVLVSPDLQYPVSWLGGPAIQSDPEARIEIVCDGFDPVTVEWFRHFPDRNSGIQEDRGVIDLGKLSLTKSKSQQAVGGNRTYYMSLPWGYTNTVALSSEPGAAVSNSVLYTKCDVFLNFVASLPAGSVLDHDAGCVVPVRYQFGDKELKVTELKDYCGQRGIKVHIYGSW